MLEATEAKTQIHTSTSVWVAVHASDDRPRRLTFCYVPNALLNIRLFN